jgi:hypothetical protein
MANTHEPTAETWIPKQQQSRNLVTLQLVQ